ncbi:MAG: DUF485 domain-containing protein [Propionibacteriales bacterium]|nr:DUF485 domain-containing protein [Propionibacteriales bacterium]
MTEPAINEKIYEDLHESADFVDLRRRYRSFAIPWTIVFFAWYMLYVICSNWAPGFMGYDLVGNINVALVFGLLQFLSTFLIAWLYSRHANRELDPIAARLDAAYEREVGR